MIDWSGVDFRWFGGILIAVGIILIAAAIYETFFMKDE